MLNVCDGIEVPFSFGGDGGLIAVPPVLDQPLAQLAPMKQGTLKFRFPPRGMKLEVVATARHGRIALRYGWVLFTATMQYLCEKFGIKIGDYSGQSY